MKKRVSTKYLIHAAVIAAIYAALTVILSPISYGPMQIRVAEALAILPMFTPAAVPGLFVGCIIANIVSPYGIADVIIGGLSTLLSAYGSRAFRRKPLFVPLPPVLINAVFLGSMLRFVYNVGMPLWACILWVGIGEAVACYLLGYPLLRYLARYEKMFYYEEAETQVKAGKDKSAEDNN